MTLVVIRLAQGRPRGESKPTQQPASRMTEEPEDVPEVLSSLPDFVSAVCPSYMRAGNDLQRNELTLDGALKAEMRCRSQMNSQSTSWKGAAWTAAIPDCKHLAL